MNATEFAAIRRLTPTEREHELAMRLAERKPTASLTPDFKVGQVKGVGGATVFEWHAHIPVCDEFPTADEAFKATLRYASEFKAEYGPSANGAA